MDDKKIGDSALTIVGYTIVVAFLATVAIVTGMAYSENDSAPSSFEYRGYKQEVIQRNTKTPVKDISDVVNK